MTHYEYGDKLATIKYLAEHKQTGTPEQLAKKLEVSERTIQRMVEQLRNHGYPIRYNRYRQSYEVEN